MDTSHEIYMNPWLAINFSLLYKKDINIENNYVFF